MTAYASRTAVTDTKKETTQKKSLSPYESRGRSVPVQAKPMTAWESMGSARFAPVQEKAVSAYESKGSVNHTGIPTQTKAKFERSTGLSLDDVRVHYNSDKPAQLQAHAFTQGSEVHIASGQEKHLGHELGHVVQQKQGRVKPTMQLQGVAVNDDEALEREADEIGAAVQMMSFDDGELLEEDEPVQMMAADNRVVQRLVENNLQTGVKVYVKRSTSHEFHKSEATIIRYLEKNHYLIELKGTEKTIMARSDQLCEKEDDSEFDVDPLNVDLKRLKRIDWDTAKNDLLPILREINKTIEKNDFIIGGSFAVMLHAFERRQSARTPRDIDVFINPKKVGNLNQKPLRMQSKLYGLPIELHSSTEFSTTESLDQKNDLLSLEIKRIIDKHHFIKNIVKEFSHKNETENIATEFLEHLYSRNDDLLEHFRPKSKPPTHESTQSDFVLPFFADFGDVGNKSAAKTWIKALKDIETLVNSGAEITMKIIKDIIHRDDNWED